MRAARRPKVASQADVADDGDAAVVIVPQAKV
jgi:hypothetical protein